MDTQTEHDTDLTAQTDSPDDAPDTPRRHLTTPSIHTRHDA